ncbi:MAG: sigma-B regulation protein RsbU (phosphoserine phosphatase) [Pseudohongiellaceae bacterium]|jgi:sigma-B regulation protein RsbU (phosphoserine phosphatase)
MNSDNRPWNEALPGESPAGASGRIDSGKVHESPPTEDSVLVVDDNPVNLRVLTSILSGNGFTSTVASTGAEALERAADTSPDLMLLDIMLPDFDGYEVCARMKADPELSQIPIIFLSGLTEARDKVNGLRAGAVDYITKPFDPSEVLARVRAQMRISKLSRSLITANRELEQRQQDLAEGLRAAADIQQSLIPRSPPASRNIELAWRFIPCEQVGGDIFNVMTMPGDELGLYMVDVSGHGVPAAMVTVSIVQSLLPQSGIVVRPAGSDDVTPPAKVIELLDHEYPFERFGKFFTISYLLLDDKTGALRYANAAHPHPILIRATGEVELLEEGGTIVGLGGMIPVQEGMVQLLPGDRVYLTTDGLAELNGPSNEEFGDERLIELLSQQNDVSLQDACDEVLSALRAWSSGALPDDDITLLALEYRGPAAD